MPEPPDVQTAPLSAERNVPKAAAFSADVPADLTHGDPFGHGDYADTLAEAVLATNGPFTFGLFGDWGMGKSTVLKALGRRLEQNGDVAFAEFDAWRYEGDAFRREFLRDVSGQLAKAEALTGWDRDNRLGPLDDDIAVVRDRRASLSVPELLRSAIGLSVLVGAFVLLGRVILKAKGVTLSLIALMPLVLFIADRLERIVKVQQQTVTRRRLEDPDRFASLFRDLVAATTRRRLVVAIDNLDRLPARDALDVLATIKTYLEPEASHTQQHWAKETLGIAGVADTTVVFVIAVDDAALRAHLAAARPAAADGSGGWDFADEYLRKFFGATTTLRPLLTGDLRDYVAGVLSPTFDRADIPESDSQDHVPPGREIQIEQTVEMTVVALRHNPRRVKQFANNLELALRLARRREQFRAGGAAPWIVPPISSHVAMIAKLVLLEEEWPDQAALLRHDDQALARWQRAAVAGDPPEVAVADVWDRLAGFLRTSREVTTPSLRAFLWLKRSKREAEMPGYEEFRTAVLDADFGQLVKVIDSPEHLEASWLTHRVGATGAGPHHSRLYAQELPAIFAEEADAGRHSTAVNVVDAALSVPRLARHIDIVKRLLADAVARPETRARLSGLAPERLRVGLGHLSADDADQLLAIMVSGLELTSEGSRPLAIIEVLVEHHARAGSRTRTAAHERFADRALRQEFWLQEPIARAAPDLLPKVVSQAAVGWTASQLRDSDFAVQALTYGSRSDESDDRLRRTRTLDDGPELTFPALVVMAAGVSRGHLDEEADECVDLVVGLFEAAAGAELAAEGAVALGRLIVPAIAMHASEDLLASAAERLWRHGDALGPEARFALLELCGWMLEFAGPRGAETATRLLVINREDLVDFVLRGPLQLPRTLRAALRRAIDYQMSWLRSDDVDAVQFLEHKPEALRRAEAAFALLDRPALASALEPRQAAAAVADWAARDHAIQEGVTRLLAGADGLGEDLASRAQLRQLCEVEPVYAMEDDPAAYRATLVATVAGTQPGAGPRDEPIVERKPRRVEIPVLIIAVLARADPDGPSWIESIESVQPDTPVRSGVSPVPGRV